jgi:hypothetical protein
MTLKEEFLSKTKKLYNEEAYIVWLEEKVDELLKLLQTSFQYKILGYFYDDVFYEDNIEFEGNIKVKKEFIKAYKEEKATKHGCKTTNIYLNLKGKV